MKQPITDTVKEEFLAYLYPNPSINPNPSVIVGFKKLPSLTTLLAKAINLWTNIIQTGKEVEK